MDLRRWRRKSFLRSLETYLILFKNVCVSLSYLKINYGLRLYAQQTASAVQNGMVMVQACDSAYKNRTAVIYFKMRHPCCVINLQIYLFFQVFIHNSQYKI
jgi:hypothetical protein